MNILVIDTCQQGLGIAIQRGEAQFFHQETNYRAQAEHLLPYLIQLLQKAKISLDKLDFIGVSIGPGAFTGMRIGISAVQGLALAHDIAVVPVSSLYWLAKTAARVSGESAILVAKDARMHEVYWGRYLLGKDAIMMPEPLVGLSAPSALLVEDFQGVCAGDAWQLYANELPDLPHSGVFWGELMDLLTLVAAYAEQGFFCKAEHLVPAYVRDRVVST